MPAPCTKRCHLSAFQNASASLLNPSESHCRRSLLLAKFQNSETLVPYLWRNLCSQHIPMYLLNVNVLLS